MAGDTTQIHTHICHAQFNDILPQIAAMDADVITIETSRSDMEPLTGFGQFQYPNEIGPGVYGIHSPQITSTVDMVTLLQKASGLKTRGWAETETALRNRVQAAQQMRAA